jgi:putative transcriptional regulator
MAPHHAPVRDRPVDRQPDARPPGAISGRDDSRPPSRSSSTRSSEMPIVITIDAVLARRKLRANEVAAMIGVRETGLSLFRSGNVRECDSRRWRSCAQRWMSSGEILGYEAGSRRLGHDLQRLNHRNNVASVAARWGLVALKLCNALLTHPICTNLTFLRQSGSQRADTVVEGVEVE